MEVNYIQLVNSDKKNPRKFSIEIDRPNDIGLKNRHFEIDKDINHRKNSKSFNGFISNKVNTCNTNLFLISNVKDNNPNENKGCLTNENAPENVNYQNTSDEKIKTDNLKENDNTDTNPNNEYNSGRWSDDEHQKFIEGILKYGNEWKKVQSIIKTRTSTQARSHAQKFFLRLKKEISPNILTDSNQLLEYIINTSNISTNNNNSTNNKNLTQEQKERLFSVIKSNLQSEDNQIKINNNQLYNDEGKGLDNINEEEDNLAYNKGNVDNTQKINLNEIGIGIGEKRKITFCSKKRKSSTDYTLTINDNRIFSIKKDIAHRKSMDVTKSNNNLINNLVENNQIEKKKIINETKNNINNINNHMILNNNNINKNKNKKNNDININKTDNYNNTNNTNFIIQNNYFNIINNYNNNNTSMNNNQMNNYFQPDYQYSNTYFNNDSINSDNNHNNKYYNNFDNYRNKDKNKYYGFEFLKDNNAFFNNENFFPNTNKNNHNENNEVNDPFNLKFENFAGHNDNTIINDNTYFNNIKIGNNTDYYDFDRIHFQRNNNVDDILYDD